MSDQQGPRPSESCLLVPVPEAELAVGRLRRRLDQSAAWGVPAHVTILYPFVLPDEMTGKVIEAAAAAVASVPAFECTFARTGWFGADGLVRCGRAGSVRTCCGWHLSPMSRSGC